MIYANEDIFNVSYNSRLDRLQINEKSRKNKIKRVIKNNKLITTLLTMFLAFCFLNGLLIYTFLSLLKKSQGFA